MKALSVHEPWATALVHGAKTIDTRTWPGRGLRPGDWIAIQASRAMTRFDWLTLRRWRAGTGLLQEIASLVEKCPHHGCVIGAVRFQVGYHYSSYPGRFLKEAHWHLVLDTQDRPDLVAWKMDDFFAIHPPIPWRGEPGLFNIPFEVDPRIAEKGVRQVHGLVRTGRELDQGADPGPTIFSNPDTLTPDTLAPYKEDIPHAQEKNE